MIQEYLMNQAKQLQPDLKWTVDYYTAEDNTGTVYYEGGSLSNVNNETDMSYPEYMVFIRCSDYSKSEVVAHKMYKLFHKKKVDELIYVPELDTSYRVYFMQAMSTPNRIGVSGDVMEYSVNLLITLREEI